MKRKLLLMMTLCALLLLGCQSNAERYGEPLIFTTGTTTGVFYSLGGGLATLWTKEMGKRVASQASNGSVENLKLMSKGEANIGFTTVNIAYEAYNGEGAFKDKPYDDVRILANLYPNVSHIVVMNKNSIQSIEDLKGKSFVFGSGKCDRSRIETRIKSPRN